MAADVTIDEAAISAGGIRHLGENAGEKAWRAGEERSSSENAMLLRGSENSEWRRISVRGASALREAGDLA